VFTSGEICGLKLERQKEAEASAKLIDAELNILNYRDGHIPVDSESVKDLAEAVNSLKPSMVFTLFPHDTHQDHRAASAITLSACRYVPSVLFYEIPHTNTGFLPNYYVDVTDSFPLKEKALACFKSQADKPYLKSSDVRALAQHRAYTVFHSGRLFEAFVLHHHIHEV